MRRVLSLFRKPKQPVAVHVRTIDGSMLNASDFADAVQRELLKHNQRNGGTGL